VAISSSQAEISAKGLLAPGAVAANLETAPPDLEVAIIGSARLSPPDPRCALAEQTGAAIAAHGWTLVTGGYGGLMEVASRAAAEAGGKVVGLPMRGWGNLTPNASNHELRWSDTYPERLAHLLATDVIVAVDGGIGTLSEAAVIWAALQTEPTTAELIFLGAGWPPVLQAIAEHLVIDDRDLACVTVCADPQVAIAHITEIGSRQRSASPRG
jgi:uncharacterized protein (TIGR00725 family)